MYIARSVQTSVTVLLVAAHGPSDMLADDDDARWPTTSRESEEIPPLSPLRLLLWFLQPSQSAILFRSPNTIMPDALIKMADVRALLWGGRALGLPISSETVHPITAQTDLLIASARSPPSPSSLFPPSLSAGVLSLPVGRPRAEHESTKQNPR